MVELGARLALQFSMKTTATTTQQQEQEQAMMMAVEAELEVTEFLLLNLQH